MTDDLVLTEPKPSWKELVAEASQALAGLDADRLEELARSCRLLNRDLDPAHGGDCSLAMHEARGLRREMAVFARVIEATRANLEVMDRLRAVRQGRREYGEARERSWAPTEIGHGDN